MLKCKHVTLIFLIELSFQKNELFRYFSLDADLNPVAGGEYAGLQGHEDDDTAWDVIDYVD